MARQVFACRYPQLVIPPRPRQRQHAASSSVSVVWQLAMSIKERRTCTPLYRPKRSSKTSPDEKEVGIKKTNECVQPSPLEIKPSKKKNHPHISSPRASAHARSCVLPWFDSLISGLRLSVPRFTLMVRSRLNFLPPRSPLLVLLLAFTLARGIDARTSRRAVVRVSAAFTTAIDLDAATAAGDSVALASTLRVRGARVAETGQRRWRRAVRAA